MAFFVGGSDLGVKIRQCRVVELRFFAGLIVEETAHALGLTEDKVKREWSTAKAWLYKKLGK